MEVKAQHHYPKGVEAVLAAFGNKKKIEARFAAMGARNIAVQTCKVTKTSMDMSMTREVPVEAPSLLKKFMGEWNQVTQVEHWTGSAAKGFTGELTLTLHGVPVSVTGSLHLHGDASSCTNEICMKFESAVPLVGKKLAEFIASGAAKEMQREYEFIRDNL
jgi:hypothetical protein